MNHHECIQKALMIALSSNKKQIISIKNASMDILEHIDPSKSN